jgi:hypothetical protein
LVRDQLRFAYDYRVLLTRLARARRAVERSVEIRAGLDAEQQAVTKAKQILAATLGAAKAARQANQSRSAPPAIRQAVAEAKAATKEANQALRERRSALREELQPERDAIHERWLSICRAARHESRLRHGTYTAVEDALSRACSDTPLWDEGEPNDPRWPPWKGEGHIGVQLQGGRALNEVFGTDTQLQIEMLSYSYANRSSKKRPKYALLRLRVGSNEDRTPIWAEFPAKLHRSMPAGSRVKRCMVSARREGPREQWTAELTVEEPEGYLREPCGKGTVAVDIGWRRLEGDRLRVAAWHDEDGNNGQVVLSPTMISSLRKPDELRAVRDKNRNEMRPQLCAWLREQPALPDWLLATTVRRRDALPSAAQAVAYLSQWKSCARFAKLARRWSQSRWSGDTDGYALLESWRYRDHHLWEWESGQSNQARRARREQYRRWAAWLARTYQTIVLEEFDLSDVAKKPSDGNRRGQQEEKASSWRQLASTSELRESVRNAASTRGAKYVERDPAYTTQECPYDDCQHVEAWDAASSIEKRPPCTKCGRSWDQDDGAALVLLRRWRRECEKAGGPENVGGGRKRKKRNKHAREGETRWQRVARLRAVKEERMGTNNGSSAP